MGAAAWSTAAVLLLTSLHHVYGAALYETPWRAHVVLPAALRLVVAACCLAVFRRRPLSRGGRAAFGLFAAGTLALTVGWVGLFEGGYNHALKDTLWEFGAPRDLMVQLFPPPAYEMPDDFLFELTGVLQLPGALLVARETWRLVRVRRRSRSKSEDR